MGESMQLNIEKQSTDGDQTDRVTIFGVKDWQHETNDNGDPQTRIFWPSSAALGGETVVPGRVTSGGAIEAGYATRKATQELIEEYARSPDRTVVVVATPVAESQLHHAVNFNTPLSEVEGVQNTRIIEKAESISGDDVEFW